MTDSYHFESVPKFRVGGVYRDGVGRIYLLREAGGEKLAVAAAWDSCDREFDPRGEFHRLDNGRFDALDFQESHWHLIPGELVQRDGQWVAADSIGPFPSGATLKVAGDKIVGRVEAELSEWDNVKPGAIINIRKPAQYITRTDTATYAAATGNRLMTAADIRAEIDAALAATFSAPASTPIAPAIAPEPIRPALDWNTATPFDPFGADFIVTKGEVPTAPLHTSPTTDSAYPAIAGLLRG